MQEVRRRFPGRRGPVGSGDQEADCGVGICGLRISDALKLPFAYVVSDSDGALYLRYCNHKMKREALVPIDDELQA
jgi:hypothetical protein